MLPIRAYQETTCVLVYKSTLHWHRMDAHTSLSPKAEVKVQGLQVVPKTWRAKIQICWVPTKCLVIWVCHTWVCLKNIEAPTQSVEILQYLILVGNQLQIAGSHYWDTSPFRYSNHIGFPHSEGSSRNWSAAKRERNGGSKGLPVMCQRNHARIMSQQMPTCTMKVSLHIVLWCGYYSKQTM